MQRLFWTFKNYVGKYSFEISSITPIGQWIWTHLPLDIMAAILQTTFSYAFSVKLHFGGPELFKKKGALFQEESYLPRIFGSSSLNLHTFLLIHIVFWWQIFFRKHGKSTPTIGKTTMFWSSTLWSWRHNAGARELSANHTLQSMTTTCR